MNNKELKATANIVGVDALDDPLFEEHTPASSKTYTNSKSKIKTLTSDHKGITLIALIITIIVMLILVAVTVTIAINGGLFKTAKQAKADTQANIDAEQRLASGRIKVDGKWYNSLEDYTKGIESLDQNDEPSKWAQDEDGKITYDGEDSGIKVGDYVDYETYVKASSVGNTEIGKLYDDLKQYSGYEGSTYKESYPITKEDLKWRVLDIKDGQIRLISDVPTTSTKIYLYGYNGYNNAVYLIDEVCNTLYTTEKGTAKNLKIEDIEEKMNLEKWDYHDYENSYVNTQKYGGTKEYTGNYSYYPEIFAKEKTGWVNDKQGIELGLSEQTEPINQTAKIPASPTSADKIKITQTYWYNSMSDGNWKNPTYQKIFIKNSSGLNYSTYWLSSRCVSAYSTSAAFDVRYVGSGGVNAYTLCNSSDINSGTSYCLRPVVSLKSDVQIGEKVGDTFKLN